MKLKEVLKFLSGFELAHLISHIWLRTSGLIPYNFNFLGFNINLTPEFNTWAIWINLIVFLLFFYFGFFRKK